MKRILTGVQGLDDILEGGLPAGHMYLLEGDPGTGKTTIAMQFLLQGVAEGRKVLYVTLSEPREELAGSAASHGWDFSKIPVVEFLPDEATFAKDQQYTVFYRTKWSWPARLRDSPKRSTRYSRLARHRFPL